MFNDIDQNTKATMTLEWTQRRQFPRVLWDFNIFFGDMLSVSEAIWLKEQFRDSHLKECGTTQRKEWCKYFGCRTNYGRKEFDADEAYSLLLSNCVRFSVCAPGFVKRKMGFDAQVDSEQVTLLTSREDLLFDRLQTGSNMEEQNFKVRSEKGHYLSVDGKKWERDHHWARVLLPLQTTPDLESVLDVTKSKMRRLITDAIE